LNKEEITIMPRYVRIAIDVNRLFHFLITYYSFIIGNKFSIQTKNKSRKKLKSKINEF